MRRNTYTFFWSALLMLCLCVPVLLAKNAPYSGGDVRGPIRGRLDVANPQDENRVHNAGKMWMNVTNYGYFGNDASSQSTALEDPCPPNNWAPQCEFPGGSDQQYLFQGGLWVGALIEEEGFFTTRVSVGTDGWQNPSINEFHAPEAPNGGIEERSIRPGFTNCFGEIVYHPNAVSDQDFICSMADTLTDRLFVEDDPVDGPHKPLGIEIRQKSYSFSQAFAEDFIIIDYEIENIASNFLKNVYVGLYVDADCGVAGDNNEHTDDVCGFIREVDEIGANSDTTKVRIDVAWIADNDGYPDQTFGGTFTVPHVTGTRVIRAPNPRLFTSFNWYNPNSDINLDYGPTWEAYANRDSMGMSWTATYGTPVGDAHKYQLMGNCEFDFWQTSVDELRAGLVPADTNCYGEGRPQTWSQLGTVDDQTAQEIADGYDTRYLLSWGPLGIYDFTDGAGNRIYRLNPGEKFKMTIAYVAGEYFHDPNNPQISPSNLDTAKFNFADLKDNARWAKDVYDNRMFDTPIFDWGLDGDMAIVDADGSQGDGILETGDGWYGEDVGKDGLFGVIPIGLDSIPVTYFHGANTLGSLTAEIFVGWYKGPDEGERNGRRDTVDNNAILQTRSPFPVVTEDDIVPPDLVYAFNAFHPLELGPWDMGWMSGNGIVDFGDGIPDFTGPPPPPIPALLDCVPGTSNAGQHSGGIVRHAPDGDCYKGGLGYMLNENEVVIRWSKSSSESETYRDPFSREQDFEGYRIHVATVNQEQDFELVAQFDRIDFAYFADGTDSMMTIPVDQAGRDTLPPDTTILNVHGRLKAVGPNTGFADVMSDYEGVYEFRVPAQKLAPRYYAITAFDYGDPKSGLTPLTTRATANAVLLAPAGSAKREVTVVPNPYRAYQDYTSDYRGQSWENQNDGTTNFYPQVDRRIEFMNLPERALIRIFTTAGDLVQVIPHNEDGDRSSWASLNSEKWDLNSRNNQQVVAGLYLFSVEDLEDHSISTGKFVIIR
ncbi:MAG: hypothetical protein IPK53_12765 [bacterium]|nr:hypothetical protein [bacterium]